MNKRLGDCVVIRSERPARIMAVLEKSNKKGSNSRKKRKKSNKTMERKSEQKGDEEKKERKERL